MTNIVEIVINSLKPNFQDCMEQKYGFNYWDGYHLELEWLESLSEDKDHLIDYINGCMKDAFSSDPEHHAATDVALTLESLAPEQYAGKFVYN